MRSARFGQLASILPDCGSTQDIVRAVAGALGPEGFVSITDHQLAGRGRRGREWRAEPGQALLLSILLRPRTPLDSLAPLSLVAGIAVAEALPVDARVRWPNDVVVGGAKIAGVLAELETPAERPPFVILGIGINVDMPPDALPPTERLPATSLYVETGGHTDRLSLFGVLMDRLQAAYEEFETLGFAALHDRFAAVDDLAGRTIDVAVGDGVVHGEAAGVDGAGRLVLRLDDGSERRLDSGEVEHVDES
jgi:BirA family transcriptional regulator, biotin operon repressor / biotin---[acetyl-CoA-carboxylase] ligase